MRWGLKILSDKLTEHRKQRAEALPPDSPAKGINFPLAQALASSLAYPDKEFSQDLAMGMPIAGDIPACGTLANRPMPATMTMKTWRESTPQRNAEAIERVKTVADKELYDLCWAKPNAAAVKGWVTGPQPLTRAIIDTRPLTQRNGIREQHGDQSEKIRLIGDFRASGINIILTTLVTSIPANLDSFLA